MPDRLTAILRVEPQMLPALVAAYQQAREELMPLLSSLRRGGRVPRPWTDDPIAGQIAERFNTYAVDGTNSAYEMLRLYEIELQNVLDTLTRMHADYLRTDDAAASLMDKR